MNGEKIAEHLHENLQLFLISMQIRIYIGEGVPPHLCADCPFGTYLVWSTSCKWAAEPRVRALSGVSIRNLNISPDKSYPLGFDNDLFELYVFVYVRIIVSEV